MKPAPLREVPAVPIRQRRSSGRRSRNRRANMRNLDRPATNQLNIPITEPYGNIIGPKPDETIRILTINPDRFPLNGLDPKNEEIFNALKKYEADVTLMSDLGNNWCNTNERDRWSTRVNKAYKWTKTKSITASNYHDKTGSQLQWGGTAILCAGEITQYSAGAGRDPSGLGRWCWTRFRGRAGIHFRTVSIYKPCINKKGEQCVYAQQARRFNETKKNRKPEEPSTMTSAKRSKNGLTWATSYISAATSTKMSTATN